MLRSWLVFLLLCNYLLVVGAGMVNRPETPRYSARHPYVHSHACQQQNYLRLDCFGTCNGDQQALAKSPKPFTPQQLLTLAKGIDLHCLTDSIVLKKVAFAAARPVRAEVRKPVPAGVANQLYSPPRRG